MARKNSGRKAELMKDYDSLEKMYVSLKKNQKDIHMIGRRVELKSNSDLEDGIAENLDIVSAHIARAQKEIGLAIKKLKMI
jgi:hypothetical protein